MKTEIKLVYIGDRSNGEQLRACFIEEGKSDREENHLHFKRGKFFIGSKYKGEKEGDRTSLYPKGLIENDEVTNEALLKKWRLESQAAIAETRNKASKLRVDKSPLPETLIEALRMHLKGLSHKDAKNYLDYLVDEILFKPMAEEATKNINAAIARMKKKETKKKGKKK
jgi:hypothetical protein